MAILQKCDLLWYKHYDSCRPGKLLLPTGSKIKRTLRTSVNPKTAMNNKLAGRSKKN